jgi:hypothetical protein
MHLLGAGFLLNNYRSIGNRPSSAIVSKTSFPRSKPWLMKIMEIPTFLAFKTLKYLVPLDYHNTDGIKLVLLPPDPLRSKGYVLH